VGATYRQTGWGLHQCGWSDDACATLQRIFDTCAVDVEYKENKLIVCKYITYFQSLIYFRTELLTRVKFSRHVWTGFYGPTGDGKWSHHKSLSIYSSEIQPTFNCIRFRRYCWRRLVVRWALMICCSNPGGSVCNFPHILLLPLNLSKNRKTWRQVKIWRFSEFPKNQIENLIYSTYRNYTQKIANSTNSNFWSTDQ